MSIAWCLHKATHTHSEYVILIVLPLQQWLHERTSVSRCTDVAPETRCGRGYGTLARQFSIYVYPTQWCTAEIQTPSQWNLIDRNMSAPPLVLTPNSILRPSFFQSSFIRERKNSGCLSKIFFRIFLIFKNSLSRGVCVFVPFLASSRTGK